MNRLLFLTALVLTGCDSAPVPEKIQYTVADEKLSGRFTIQKIATFYDSTAYNSTRDVFLITDKNTDTEFLGISGVGVGEIGSHGTGKTTVRDER